MSNVAIPAKDQVEAMIRSQQSRFIKTREYDPALVNQTDDGPVAVIGEEEIPLLDMAFDVQVVQPGHVRNNKELASLVGKIVVMLDPSNPGDVTADELTLMPVTIVSFGFRNFGPFDEKGGEDDKKLLCYSTDGVQPSRKLPAPMNPVCSELVLQNGEYHRRIVCPYAQWDGDKKPDCRAVVTLGLFDLERKIPLRLQLHGTAYGAWTSLQRAYKQARNVARLKKKSINDYVIKMTVENNGTYMTPQFKLVEADGETGKPSDYLPVCKYYMDTVFARLPEETPPPAQIAEDKVGEITEGDEKELAEASDFVL